MQEEEEDRDLIETKHSNNSMSREIYRLILTISCSHVHAVYVT